MKYAIHFILSPKNIEMTNKYSICTQMNVVLIKKNNIYIQNGSELII